MIINQEVKKKTNKEKQNTEKARPVEEQKQTKSLLFTLFLIVFIDLIGIGIIIPVLPVIFLVQTFCLQQFLMQREQFYWGCLLHRIRLRNFLARQF